MIHGGVSMEDPGDRDSAPVRIFAAIENGDALTALELWRRNSYLAEKPAVAARALAIAAKSGQLWLLQQLGLDVSAEAMAHTGMYQQLLSYAAAGGNVEVISWLLSQHACTMERKRSTAAKELALCVAARHGNLKAVRWLVKHGTSVNAARNGVNALMHAKFNQHGDIVAYLIGEGAVDLRATVSPQLSCSHEYIVRTMVLDRGYISDRVLSIPGNPNVHLYMIPRDCGRGVPTIFSVGLSDHPLPSGHDDLAATEVCITLPDEPTEACWQWALEWLTRVTINIRSMSQWPTDVVVPCDSPESPGQNSALCYWTCSISAQASLQLPDARWIQIRSPFPLYASEAEMISSQGIETFVRRRRDQGDPEVVDPTRTSVTQQT